MLCSQLQPGEWGVHAYVPELLGVGLCDARLVPVPALRQGRVARQRQLEPGECCCMWRLASTSRFDTVHTI